MEPIKVYRDGEFDAKTTGRIYAKYYLTKAAHKAGKYVDNFFINHTISGV